MFLKKTIGNIISTLLQRNVYISFLCNGYRYQSKIKIKQMDTLPLYGSATLAPFSICSLAPLQPMFGLWPSLLFYARIWERAGVSELKCYLKVISIKCCIIKVFYWVTYKNVSNSTMTHFFTFIISTKSHSKMLSLTM